MDLTAGPSRVQQPKRKNAEQQADVKSSKQKNKKSKKSFPVVPLRVPHQEDCQLSDDLADSVRTLCKVCDQAFTLNYMRFHTKEKHMLQITKYKELYGPFQIIQPVFHKCKLCGKIVLLDSDTLGGHIKGVHKMKEKMYKERFMTYSLHLNPSHTIQSARGIEATNNEIKGLDTDTEEDHNLQVDMMGTRQSCNVGLGGWRKKFLPTDLLFGGEREYEEYGDDIDENNVTMDFSDLSLVEDTDDSIDTDTDGGIDTSEDRVEADA